MREQRHYSPEEKAAALAALAANQGNLKRTARDLGIPFGTLAGWREGKDGAYNQKQPPQAARQRARFSLADSFEKLAWRMVRLAPKAARIAAEKGNLSALAVCMGIAVDKMRLLREQATSLPGSALSPEDKDRRIAEIKAAAAARRALAEADKSTATGVAVEPSPVTDPPQVSPQPSLDALVDLAAPHPDRPTDARPGGGV